MKKKLSITLEESTVEQLELFASNRSLKMSQAIERKIDHSDRFYQLFEELRDIHDNYSEKPEIESAMVGNLIKLMNVYYEQ